MLLGRTPLVQSMHWTALHLTPDASLPADRLNWSPAATDAAAVQFLKFVQLHVYNVHLVLLWWSVICVKMSPCWGKKVERRCNFAYKSLFGQIYTTFNALLVLGRSLFPSRSLLKVPQKCFQMQAFCAKTISALSFISTMLGLKVQ